MRLSVRRAFRVAAAAALATVALVVPSAGSASAAGEDERWVEISAGWQHTCGVTSTGDAYCWGDDSDGQLGNGAAGSSQVPTRVADPAAGPVAWASVSVGDNHTCALTTDGEAYCWGMDGAGRLGNGAPYDSEQVPSPVSTPSGVTWRSIDVGGAHSCGVTTDGDAYCWGSDFDGRLGNADAPPSPPDAPGPMSAVPSLVAGDHTWLTVRTGWQHTCGVTTDGDAYCWGLDDSGQLGDGPASISRTAPEPVDVSGTGVTDLEWVSVRLGDTATCGVTTDGDAYCWGYNGNGTLGDGGSPANRAAPGDPVVGGGDWDAVVVGGQHACGLSGTDAFCWGSRTYGQLGDGTAVGYVDTPQPAGAGTSWASLSTGFSHTCGVTTDGAGFCWGVDWAGQLGTGPGPLVQPDPVALSQVEQTIESVDVPAEATFGDTVTLSAVVDSGYAPVWETSGPCTADGDTLTFTGAGECTVTATQPGSVVRAAAAPFEPQVVTVGRAASEVVLDAGPTVEDEPVDVDVTVTSAAGGAPTGVVLLSVGGLEHEVTLESGAGTAAFDLPVGTHEIAATYAGDDDHAGSEAVLTVTVEPATTDPAPTDPAPTEPSLDDEPTEPADDDGDTRDDGGDESDEGGAGDLADTGFAAVTVLLVAFVLVGLGVALRRSARARA